MKKVLLIITIVLAVIVAGGAIAGFVLFNQYKDDPTFIKGTTFNGDPAAYLTPEEVADEFAVQFNTANIKVVIRENGKPSIEKSLEEMGYSYDKQALTEFLIQVRDEQRKDIFTLISTLMNGYKITATDSYLNDPSVISSIVTSGNLAEKRVRTVDNEIVFDKEKNRYHVEEGSTGNEIDDAALQAFVKTSLNEAFDEPELSKEIVIDIPESVYTSLPPAGDLAAMQEECDAKNHELEKQEVLDSYRNSSVTYVFGNETEVLDYDVFGSWLSINDELEVTIDEESVGAYVERMIEIYDTLYMDRTFKTTAGNVVTILAGDNGYGYAIDYNAEFAQLLADLYSKTPVMREPIYIETNDYGNPYYYSRNGLDDLNGTYVEINLTAQHLWYYVGGQLLVDCDIVSGSVAKDAETKIGVFPLAWKNSPETLKGADADGSGSYSVKVQYWMPFYNGQGLHDASFRNEFGGDIYKKNGSHGCVNLPPKAAETIYNNIEIGVPIIIYKE